MITLMDGSDILQGRLFIIATRYSGWYVLSSMRILKFFGGALKRDNNHKEDIIRIDGMERELKPHNGIPFMVTLPVSVPARDEMTAAQFNQIMEIGLKQAKEDDSFDVDGVFLNLNKVKKLLDISSKSF